MEKAKDKIKIWEYIIIGILIILYFLPKFGELYLIISLILMPIIGCIYLITNIMKLKKNKTKIIRKIILGINIVVLVYSARMVLLYTMLGVVEVRSDYEIYEKNYEEDLDNDGMKEDIKIKVRSYYWRTYSAREMMADAHDSGVESKCKLYINRKKSRFR